MNRRHLFALLGASALSPLVPKLPEGVPMTVVRETVYERGSWVDFTWLAIIVASPVVGVLLLYFADVAWDRWMPW